MITVSLASQAKSLTFSSTVTGTPSTASALQYCTSAGAIGDSLISQGSITGRLTLSKSGTTARTVTFPDAAITVAGINLAQTWTATQTFAAIGATTVSASGAITCAGLTSSGANGQFLVQNGSTAGGMRLTAFNAAGNANGYLQFEGYSSVYGKINADGTWVIGPSDPGGSEIVRVDGSGRFSGSITCASLTSSGGSTPSDPASGAVAIGNGTIKAYNEITVTDGTLLLRLYPANLQLHRTGAASYTDITGIGGTYVIRTSNAASLDTTALTFAANGAATFGSGITCASLTSTGKLTLAANVPASFADLAAVRSYLASVIN